MGEPETLPESLARMNITFVAIDVETANQDRASICQVGAVAVRDGEYHTALRDRSTLFRVNANVEEGEHPLCVPYWALSFDELLRVTPFRGVSDADRAAIVDKVIGLKTASLHAQARDGVDVETVTVETPVPFSIHRLWYELHRFVCSTHTASSASQSTDTEAIEDNEEGHPMLGDIMRAVPPRYRPITSSGGPGGSRVQLSSAPLNIRRQIHAMGSLLRD